MIYSLPFCLLLSIFYSCNVSAYEGLGDVAAHISEPLSVVIQLVRAVSIICGLGLVLGGILKYIDYRRNPVAIRLSAVIYMFIFGAALIIVGQIPLHLNG